jgi:hypothetical protein
MLPSPRLLRLPTTYLLQLQLETETGRKERRQPSPRRE